MLRFSDTTITTDVEEIPIPVCRQVMECDVMWFGN